MSSVERDVPASNVKLRLHRKPIKSLVLRMKGMKGGVSGVEEKMNQLRTRVGRLGRKISRFETRISELETRMPEVVDGIWCLDVKMTGVRGELAMWSTR